MSGGSHSQTRVFFFLGSMENRSGNWGLVDSDEHKRVTAMLLSHSQVVSQE